MTAASQRHLARVAALGCVVCRDLGHGWVEAEAHHIRAAAGAGQRSSDWLAIPLCPDHHRNGGRGVAIHDGRKAFEALYGTELDLLARTIEAMSE